jgi:hypothetical protein
MIAGGHSASDLCTDSDANDKHGAQGFQSLGAGHPHADGLEFLFQLSPRVAQSPLWGFSFARSLSEINLASVIKRILSGSTTRVCCLYEQHPLEPRLALAQLFAMSKGLGLI